MFVSPLVGQWVMPGNLVRSSVFRNPGIQAPTTQHTPEDGGCFKHIPGLEHMATAAHIKNMTTGAQNTENMLMRYLDRL